jgi:hypothetical protein
VKVILNVIRIKFQNLWAFAQQKNAHHDENAFSFDIEHVKKSTSANSCSSQPPTRWNHLGWTLPYKAMCKGSKKHSYLCAVL